METLNNEPQVPVPDDMFLKILLLPSSGYAHSYDAMIHLLEGNPSHLIPLHFMHILLFTCHFLLAILPG